MKTHEIFACLKHGYKAVCDDNSEIEVFVNKDGRFFQTDDFGNPTKFLPENYPTHTWHIVSIGGR